MPSQTLCRAKWKENGKVVTCDRPAAVDKHGLCLRHLKRYYATGKTGGPIRELRRHPAFGSH